MIIDFTNMAMPPISKKLFLSSGLITLSLLLVPPAQATAQGPSGPRYGGVLISDLTPNQVLLSRDLNGDGDADDDGEVVPYFDAQNQSGLADPTSKAFSIHRGPTGFVYIADGGTDAVYRLDDINYDGDANDAGEASVWFSESESVSGLTLPTPNGVFEHPQGDVYIVNAGVRARPDDAVYRTRDLNMDGDANDQGEATRWLDLSSLASEVIGASPNVSSAFDIVFVGDAALIADTVGRETNVIFRAQDQDESGSIDPDELTVWLNADNEWGAPVATGLAVLGEDVYVVESSRRADQSVYRLRDLDGDGQINGPLEATKVWSESNLNDDVAMGSAFGIAASPSGEIYITSAGQDEQDNIIRLIDLDGDGLFNGIGETKMWRRGNGDDPVEFARALAVEPEFLSALGYQAVSGVNDHNALPRDINEILSLLAVADQGEQPDYQTIATIYRQGKFSIKPSGQIRTIAGFADGVDSKKAEKNFANLFPDSLSYFREPGFLSRLLEDAMNARGAYRGASDRVRAAALRAGLYSTLAYWVRFELRYSELKARSGNFACPKGAPHNWDEGFAFYFGPKGRFGLYAHFAELGKNDARFHAYNEAILEAFRSGIGIVAPFAPAVGQIECPTEADLATYPIDESRQIEAELRRAFFAAMNKELEHAASASDPGERLAAVAAARAYYLAIAPAMRAHSPWTDLKLRWFFKQPRPSQHGLSYLRWTLWFSTFGS